MRAKRTYIVTETFECVSVLEVRATSKADALAKVEDHLTRAEGNPDVDPVGTANGSLIRRRAQCVKDD